MADTFVINHSVTYSEALGLFFYQVPKMKIMKRMFLYMGIISLLGFCFEIYYQPSNWPMAIPLLILPLACLTVFMTVVCSIILAVLMKLRPGLYKATYRFTHWGMEKTGNGNDFSWQWSKFLKYRETKNYLFLYLSEVDAHAVQKRMFDSPAQLNEFREFIAGKINAGHLFDNH